MPKPSVGRIVHTLVDPRVNNGEDVAAALVTKVRKVDDDERVNLRVFLDTGADLRLTNVEMRDKRPDENEEGVDTTVEGVQRVAFWPPRS